MFHKNWLTTACLLLMTLVAARAHAQKATAAGEFTVEPPTLLSLGFDWKIAGDDNRNASVDVSYRKNVHRYNSLREYSDANGNEKHTASSWTTTSS